MEHSESQACDALLESQKHAPGCWPAGGCLGSLFKSPSSELPHGVEKDMSGVLLIPMNHYIVQPKSPEVIHRLAEAMGLCTLTDCESSLHALYQYGDTACSGVWYALAHKESVGNLEDGVAAGKCIMKGDYIMLVGLSGTLRTNGLILRACQDVSCTQDTWENLQSKEVSEAFQRYLKGEKYFLNIPSKVSDREECRKQSQNPFYPFLHPIGQVDIERFIADA